MPSNAYLTLVFNVSDFIHISSCYKNENSCTKELEPFKFFLSILSLFKKIINRKLLNNNYLIFKQILESKEL